VRDVPELLPVCFLSGSTNPLLNHLNTGDIAITSGHPFVRSFVSFEVLPLVEFVPAPGISDEDAIDMIRTPTQANPRRKFGMHASTTSSLSHRGFEEEEEDPTIGAMGEGGVDLFNNAVNRMLALFEGHAQDGESPHPIIPVFPSRLWSRQLGRWSHRPTCRLSATRTV
jgi:intraflagellar transport protein 122